VPDRLVLHLGQRRVGQVPAILHEDVERHRLLGEPDQPGLPVAVTGGLGGLPQEQPGRCGAC
jgi:hypothetical protein